LNDVYGVETKLRGKTLSFKHPERERFIRANKLGADYEREGLEHVFARQIEREQEHERAISRKEGTQRTDEKLYQSSHERANREISHDTELNKTKLIKTAQIHKQNTINFEHARQNNRRKRREYKSNFKKWTRGNGKEQQQDRKSSSRDAKIER